MACGTPVTFSTVDEVKGMANCCSPRLEQHIHRCGGQVATSPAAHGRVKLLRSRNGGIARPIVDTCWRESSGWARQNIFRSFIPFSHKHATQRGNVSFVYGESKLAYGSAQHHLQRICGAPPQSIGGEHSAPQECPLPPDISMCPRSARIRSLRIGLLEERMCSLERSREQYDAACVLKNFIQRRSYSSRRGVHTRKTVPMSRRHRTSVPEHRDLRATTSTSDGNGRRIRCALLPGPGRAVIN